MIGRGNGKPGTHSVPGYSHARSKAARIAAIEKSLSYYLMLECGHFAPKEVRELYRVFGTVSVFCEACNNWSDPVRENVKTEYPNVPLF